jgi:hypothetical protein
VTAQTKTRSVRIPAFPLPQNTTYNDPHKYGQAQRSQFARIRTPGLGCRHRMASIPLRPRHRIRRAGPGPLIPERRVCVASRRHVMPRAADDVRARCAVVASLGLTALLLAILFFTADASPHGIGLAVLVTVGLTRTLDQSAPSSQRLPARVIVGHPRVGPWPRRAPP